MKMNKYPPNHNVEREKDHKIVMDAEKNQFLPRSNEHGGLQDSNLARNTKPGPSKVASLSIIFRPTYILSRIWILSLFDSYSDSNTAVEFYCIL